MNLSGRTRLILLVLGLALLLVSLAALAYAFQPGETLSGSATVAPTLFTLPAGGAP